MVHLLEIFVNIEWYMCSSGELFLRSRVFFFLFPELRSNEENKNQK